MKRAEKEKERLDRFKSLLKLMLEIGHAKKAISENSQISAFFLAMKI